LFSKRVRIELVKFEQSVLSIWIKICCQFSYGAILVAGLFGCILFDFANLISDSYLSIVTISNGYEILRLIEPLRDRNVIYR